MSNKIQLPYKNKEKAIKFLEEKGVPQNDSLRIVTFQHKNSENIEIAFD
ncbi:hypothetical protein ROU73_003492 [Escherichia coli]|nr:hypothetical protein [Escherichia coli]ELH6219626.1 hypothetical protein [Escherichia coli]